jgi:Ca-activated chloride channel family protein
MPVIRPSLLVVLVSVAIVATLSGQSQPPTFSAGNRTVAIYATVTSPAGRLVTDLEQNRFDILDNGKKQELTLFANDIQPITIVMLLDRSGSMRQNFELVEQAGEAFVAAMLPADKARIGSFSNRIQVDPQEFTSDHAELLSILRRELQEEGPTPLWNAVNVGITALLHQDGRRVILVFTDGVDMPMNFHNNNSSLKSVMKRAEEENVMIYAIGLTGDQGPHGSGRGGYPPGGFPGGGGFPGAGGGRHGGYGGGLPGGGSHRASLDGPDPGLKELAAATGGGYFELTETANMAATFRRVADELHHQYALGFTPPALDGKMHDLTVRIRDAGDAVVRARKRYLAEKPRT